MKSTEQVKLKEKCTPNKDSGNGLIYYKIITPERKAENQYFLANINRNVCIQKTWKQ